MTVGMQIEISARHFTLGDQQRESIMDALGKIEKFCPRPAQSLNLTVTHDAGHFSADAVLHLKSHDFRAKAQGAEPEIATHEVIESLRKQLAKHKGKTSAKQKGESGGLGQAMPMDLNLNTANVAADLAFELKDMDVDTAMDNFRNGEHPFLIFRNSADSRVGVIYRNDAGALIHMGEQG